MGAVGASRVFSMPGQKASAAPRRRRPRRHRPPLRVRLRHLFEEAGLHLAATFSELADWIRLGR